MDKISSSSLLPFHCCVRKGTTHHVLFRSILSIFQIRLNKRRTMAEGDISEFFHRSLQFNSFTAFQEMKEKSEQIDVVVRVGNQAFPAHRIVLSAAILYFRTMFGSGMSESKTKEITMKGTDPEALKHLIDYAYTGHVKITSENVQSLLTTAEFLQIAEVKDACCKFLSEHLTPSNVMSIQAIAKSVNCSNLVQTTNTYIREQFENFCLVSDFLNLSFSFLNKLIRRDDLRVGKEEIVFDAVLRWVKADPKRNSLLPKLLTGIRMTLLKPDYLIKTVSNEKLIRLSIPCRDLVDEAKHWHVLQKDATVCSTLTTKERSCNIKKPTAHPLLHRHLRTAYNDNISLYEGPYTSFLYREAIPKPSWDDYTDSW